MASDMVTIFAATFFALTGNGEVKTRTNFGLQDIQSCTDYARGVESDLLARTSVTSVVWFCDEVKLKKNGGVL